jgi:uncharacterized protein
MKNYNLPTRDQCFEIIKKYNVPPHIVRHSQAVAKLAVFLAQRLKEKGIAVDTELVDKACLLHDLARVCDLRESDYMDFAAPATKQQKAAWRRLKEKYEAVCHEEIANDLLKRKYPVLALVIKKHRFSALLDEKDKPETWEEKIVYYADKRVTHERIVTLKERLEEAHYRNAHLRQRQTPNKVDVNEVDRLIFELERQIFAVIDLNPDEVTEEFIGSL